MDGVFGEVTLRDVPGERIDRLCFGRFTDERTRTRKARVCRFSPGHLFGLVRWTRDRHDRQHRFLLIASFEPAAGERIAVPDLSPDPAVHALVAQDGPAGTDGPVDELLDLIVWLERRRVDPAEVSPAAWRRIVASISMRESIDPLQIEALARPHGDTRHAPSA